MINLAFVGFLLAALVYQTRYLKSVTDNAEKIWTYICIAIYGAGILSCSVNYFIWKIGQLGVGVS